VRQNKKNKGVLMNTSFEKKEELHVEADLKLLSEVSDFVRKCFTSFGSPEKICKQMDIVVEEIFTNISSYAYPQDASEKPVNVICGLDKEYIYLVFSDKGVQYNPLAKDDPVIGIADQMTIGGYGIFMVKQIVDEIEYRYEYENGTNILNMRKIIR
jgi:anti-sigma regulatory factor (Ser/Thr protein kinase)